jgi:hypothetical protein
VVCLGERAICSVTGNVMIFLPAMFYQPEFTSRQADWLPPSSLKILNPVGKYQQIIPAPMAEVEDAAQITNRGTVAGRIRILR